MIVNEISLIIQNIISKILKSFYFLEINYFVILEIELIN